MEQQTISKIVKASGISASEMILIHFWGGNADKEIANSFMVAVTEMGATPVLLQQSFCKSGHLPCSKGKLLW